jgi:FkbM family methyltransferase
MVFRNIIDKYFIKQPRLRRLITRILESDQDRVIQVLGAPLTINTIKEHGYLRAARKSELSSVFSDEASVLISLAILMEDGDTFVDIGANVGLFTAVIARARHIYPRCLFYAFEANPDTYRRLCRTIEGLNVKAFPIALSDHSGVLTFVEGAVSHVFTDEQHASNYNVQSWRRTVACDRLDSLSVIGDSLILKIDVEGQELCVLNGASALFSQDRVKAVYVDGFKDPEVVTFLGGRGFDFFDGRSLSQCDTPGFSLLAIKRRPPILK